MVVWACLCVGGASENFLLKTRYINSLFDLIFFDFWFYIHISFVHCFIYSHGLDRSQSAVTSVDSWPGNPLRVPLDLWPGDPVPLDLWLGDPVPLDLWPGDPVVQADDWLVAMTMSSCDDERRPLPQLMTMMMRLMWTMHADEESRQSVCHWRNKLVSAVKQNTKQLCRDNEDPFPSNSMGIGTAGTSTSIVGFNVPLNTSRRRFYGSDNPNNSIIALKDDG